MTHVQTDAHEWKHRTQSLRVTLDFSDYLSTGENVSEVDSVTVALPDPKTSGEWNDHASEFSPTTSIDGGEVTVRLASAQGASDQGPGIYTVLVQVTTDDGDSLARTTTIEVFVTGDPSYDPA